MVKAESEYHPTSVSPPGTTLKDALEEIGLTQSELATRMGRPIKTISEIINGKASITPETAAQLELVLGISAEFWNSREYKYQDYLVRQGQISEWKTLLDWIKLFPLSDLYTCKYVSRVKEPSEQVRNVLQFLGVTSDKQWDNIYSHYQVAFRQSSAFKVDPYSVGAWLRAGLVEAQGIRLSAYSKKNFLGALDAIKGITNEDPDVFIPELRRHCAAAGVAVVFVPQFKGSRVSGATRWLNKDNALIQLSLRYKTTDHLWFTFFHEAAHILLHGKKLIFLDSTKNEGELEKEADEWASDFLIPPLEYDIFCQEDDYTKSSICSLADKLGIAPGIVVSRLQHDHKIPYNHHNDLKSRLRWAEKQAS